MHATRERPTRPTVLGPARIALLLVTAILPMAFLCRGTGSGGGGGGTGGGSPPPEVSLKDYTNACLKAIHLDPAKDLIGPWDCTSGNPLEVRVNGKVKDIGKCAGPKCAPGVDASEGNCCPNEGDPTLAKCDYPAWLDNKCYGNSFVQEVKTSNPMVQAVLLCRHKKRISAKPDKFDDIAIIAHNSGNGETCWFQAEKDAALDGKVHGPLSSQVRPDFWMTPTETRDVYCVKCHDNGPFMNSRWMRNAISLEDSDVTPYRNSTPPFDIWPQPVWVKLDPKKDKLDDNLNECTFCHKIAAGLQNVDPRGGIGGPHFRTCGPEPATSLKASWIARSTGNKHPFASDIGDEESVVYWMPETGDGRTPHDGNKSKNQEIGHKKTDFEGKYRDHINELLKCCSAAGREPSKPEKWPAGCLEHKQPCDSCPVPEVNGKCPVSIPVTRPECKK